MGVFGRLVSVKVLLFWKSMFCMSVDEEGLGWSVKDSFLCMLLMVIGYIILVGKFVCFMMVLLMLLMWCRVMCMLYRLLFWLFMYWLENMIRLCCGKGVDIVCVVMVRVVSMKMVCVIF